MKRVYSTYDPMLVGHLESVLLDAEIPCLVKNKHLIGAAGDIPPLEVWPEIWVMRDTDADRAREIIEALVAEPVAGEPWTCPTCSEEIDAQFSECWNCAATDGDLAPGVFPA